ncbi:hypothetical protein C4577_07495 [Candidatus Parcubacteria bacterium]|nr:MAG: hypothetical protein C4577_07495 [Candidatus Parcubacteria bacterium]
MPATHKVVNGIQVPLTPEEAATIEAEWVNNAPGTGATWLAEQAAILANLRNRAKNVVAEINGDTDYLAKVIRALALTILEETNRTREWLMSFKTEVAAATNLADLKTRVAGLPDRPEVSASDLKTVIRSKIDAGEVDS